MEKIFKIGSFCLSNILFLNGYFINPVIAAEPNIENRIEVDYLKNIPENDYIIGPGDSLSIVISREYPELDTISSVDGEGTIYLPKLHRVFVSGLTIKELNDLLNKAYIEFVKFPNPEVYVQNYRPVRVFIDGEVQNPGLQTLSGAISLDKNLFEKEDSLDNSLNSQRNTSSSKFFPTVFDAIRKAGGITQYSDLRNVRLVRINNKSNGGGKKETILNFQETILRGDSTQNIRIYDGDLITVSKSKNIELDQLSKAVKSNLNKKFINVFVSGRVKSPGNIKLSKTSTLNDAVYMAGGPKFLRGKMRFIRILNDGTTDKRKISFNMNSKRGSYRNPFLRDGDLIIVDDSIFTTTSEVITEVTSPLMGIFSSYALIQAISD